MKDRFISVIVEPGKPWSDHQVIDLKRKTVVARCSRSNDADAIAKALNDSVFVDEDDSVRILLSDLEAP